ncbi:hypothetical protein I4U23_015943 [Adineta vaga]|nr:hypothetical protein I4U23_015943 [Adineta vaga]
MAVIKASNSSLIVQTQQGIYIGGQIVINGTNVNYWFDIPYAQQPIRNLRSMLSQSPATANKTK